MPTKSEVMADIRQAILVILPTATVVQGQSNRVSPPKGNVIYITAVSQKRLATDETEYSDPYPLAGSQTMQMAMQYGVQIDCYGESSNDNAETISTVFRSEYGCSLFTVVQPLYADDAIQIPLISGEQQFIERWLINAIFQYNPSFSTDQQFADTLGPVGIYDVQ